MSTFSSILEKTKSLNARVERLERELAQNPGDYALQKDLRSLSRLKLRYEQELQYQAQSNHVDICRYRMISADNYYGLTPVSESISRFQKLLTSLYDAKVNGPKTRARFTAEIERLSSLNLAYTYSGSLGFVFTLPNERDLVSGVFDDVIDKFYEIMHLKTENDVSKASQEVGVAAVSQLYNWTSCHSKAGYGLDFHWKRSDGRELGSHFDANTMFEMTNMLSYTSQDDEEYLEVDGVLVGIDVKTSSGSFHFVVPGGDSFHGVLASTFARSANWQVNKRYRAHIIKHTRVYLATARVHERLYLQGLENDLYE